MKIQIAESLNHLPLINSNELVPLQGNLKDLSTANYNKLKKSIAKKKFFVPLYIWFSPDGRPNILDGHQRHRLISKEVPKGLDLPYVAIQADSVDDAKEKLLLIDSSYGEVTKEGYDEFTGGMLDAEQFTKEFTTYDNWVDETVPGEGAAGSSLPATNEGPIGATFAVNLDAVSLAECVDNIEFMKRYPDGYFDIAVVDPEYGLNMGNKPVRNAHKTKGWDKKIPSAEYFTELFRVSKNQVIWGGNYFIEFLKNTQCFIFWYKHQPVKNFAAGELAWTSFQQPAVCFDYEWYGNHENGSSRKEKSIHPTQKPVELYEFTFEQFVKPGHKILDTHLGSGSSRIAALKMGLDFYACDNDPEIFQDQQKRFSEFLISMNYGKGEDSN